MHSFDPTAVLAEARELQAELRRVRRAIVAEGDPERSAEHVADRDALRTKLNALAAEPEHQEVLEGALTARAAALRTAVMARRRELASRAAGAEADELVSRAIAQHRSLTSRERTRVAALRADAAAPACPAGADQDAMLSPLDGVLEALGTLRLREARDQLRNGLLLTGQMRGIIAEAAPALLRGDPVLLLGETGGAKTALAEHLARTTTGAEPELVSGYGDISSAQVIGTHELRAENGATVSVFTPGPLLRAMQEGRAVILDEVNAMPAEFLKRLNRILQLRPGDTLRVQEDAGREVRIAPGFAILATANEQTPHRYRGVDRLSSELVNRFGANSYRVHYPDTGVRFEDFPVENGLLAAAAAVDSDGLLPSEWRADELVRVARAAFISQQVFSGAVSDGFGEYVSTEREIDGRPGLEESVLAPRTLVAMVQKVSASAGSVTLEGALTRFVEGVMHREDRRVLALILEGQGFSLGTR
ncbi:AAA family ATPase [Leucobacter chromiireducens]|uniref:AAA family ATPase n=1 Tax=Leucobacter chromiireducens TaxID=283877 RepID=UPI003F7D6B1D